MVPVLHIVRGSVTENLQYVAENFHTVAETLHTVPARVATVQRAVAQDMRALWEGAEANFHDVHAVDDSVPAEAEAPAQGRFEGWRLPLGWISLAAGAAVIAGLGLAQIEVRERQQSQTTTQQNQKSRGLAKKALRRTRSSMGRTDWSKSG
ncbi:MAG: hypothetical protein E6J62_04300 [Deltaproteobacteria bacterium]|nr:MAG: hypothetical protein E6J62_04300 [Deltaproteobacteria bacterium]